MMRLFTYTSKHFEGEVLAGFSKETNYICLIDFRKAQMAVEQHRAFLSNFPLTLEMLEALVAKDKDKRKIVEILDEITFEMAWDKYNHKALSHKKKSQAKWLKMSDGERAKAYQFIETYENHLIRSNGVAKKHFETFLTAELWNN